jgi:Clustered mitochondria/Translation initiation factor eIF3 subunit 135/Tetratricopeptide repeat
VGFELTKRFLCCAVLFKFAVDREGMFGWATSSAIKVAGHELRGLICYANAKVKDLRLPLMCLVDYRGHRLVAISLLPLGDGSLILGSDDAAQSVHYDVAGGAEQLSDMLREAALELNLARHSVSKGGGDDNEELVDIWTAVDVEGHRGTDGHFYLHAINLRKGNEEKEASILTLLALKRLDFSRTMPPTFPRHRPGERPGSHLYELFRPEFVKAYPRPLCSDGFSSFLRHDPDRASHNRRLRQATAHLWNVTVPNFVRNDLLPAVADATRHKMLDSFRLTAALHRAGINCRYIGVVLSHVPAKARVARLLLIVEALARSCKRNLRALLRREMKRIRVPLEEPYRRCVIAFFNLVFGSSEQSERYAEQLRLQMTSQFEIQFLSSASSGETRMPLMQLIDSTALRGSMMLFERLATSTGVKFTGRGIRKLRALTLSQSALPSSRTSADVAVRGGSLRLANPIDDTDLLELGVRAKHVGLVAEAQAEQFLIRGLLMMPSHPAACPYFFSRAIRDYEEALDSNPNNPALLKQLGLACERFMRVSDSSTGKNLHRVDESIFDLDRSPICRKAAAYFQRAIELDPKDPFTLHQYARFLQKCRRYESAEDHYLRALEADISYHPVYLDYATFLQFDKPVATSEQRRRHEALQVAVNTAGSHVKHCVRELDSLAELMHE